MNQLESNSFSVFLWSLSLTVVVTAAGLGQGEVTAVANAFQESQPTGTRLYSFLSKPTGQNDGFYEKKVVVCLKIPPWRVRRLSHKQDMKLE